jgi:hypothetical protein
MDKLKETESDLGSLYLCFCRIGMLDINKTKEELQDWLETSNIPLEKWLKDEENV